MAITNGYCTLAELKARLGIALTDTADDATLEQVITAVSRQIDNETGRRFWVNATDEIRYESSSFSDVLFLVEDVVSLTALATDGDASRTWATTWAATDYALLPANAALDGVPYTWIEIAPNGNYTFPRGRNAIKLTGKFGWSAAPAPIKEGCLLQCERIFLRKDAPFGVAGSPETGMLRIKAELDPDVQRLIAPYRRYV
jgi:hypothetical protein